MARKPKTFAERRKIVERFRKQQAREEFLVRGPERFTDIPKYLFQRSVERGKDQVVTGLLGQSLGYAVLKSRSARPGQRFKEFKSLVVDRTSGRMGVVGDVIRAKSRGRFDDNVTKGNADEKFEAIRNKFLGINDAVKVIDENFNKVNKRIEKLEKNAVELKNLNSLVKSVEDLDKKFDALDNKVDKQFSDFDTKFRLIMREMNQQSERVNVRGMTPRDQVVSGGGTGTGSGDILNQLLKSLPSAGTAARGGAAAALAAALAAGKGALKFGARVAGPIGAAYAGYETFEALRNLKPVDPNFKTRPTATTPSGVLARMKASKDPQLNQVGKLYSDLRRKHRADIADKMFFKVLDQSIQSKYVSPSVQNLKNYGTMGDDIDFGGGIPSSVGNVRRAQMNLGAKTSTRQRIGGMPPLSMRDSSRGQLDFQSQFLRQQIEQQKSQFLKFGQLPPGFEFLQGNMGRLGSAQAVAARGAMPLMGMPSGGNFGGGFSGGNYGGSSYSGGGGSYSSPSSGGHSGIPSNMPPGTASSPTPNQMKIPTLSTTGAKGPYDASKFDKEIRETPGLWDHIVKLGAKEQGGGNVEEITRFYETVRNRAINRGTSISNITDFNKRHLWGTNSTKLYWAPLRKMNASKWDSYRPSPNTVKKLESAYQNAYVRGTNLAMGATHAEYQGTFKKNPRAFDIDRKRAFFPENFHADALYIKKHERPSGRLAKFLRPGASAQMLGGTTIKSTQMAAAVAKEAVPTRPTRGGGGSASGSSSSMPSLSSRAPRGSSSSMPPLSSRAPRGSSSSMPPLPTRAPRGSSSSMPPLPTRAPRGSSSSMPPLPSRAPRGSSSSMPPLPSRAPRGVNTKPSGGFSPFGSLDRPMDTGNLTYSEQEKKEWLRTGSERKAADAIVKHLNSETGDGTHLARIAMEAYGLQEYGEERGWLKEFFKKGNITHDPKGDKNAWCATFVQAVVQQSGIKLEKGVNWSAATNWAKAGQKINSADAIKAGDIAIKHRGLKTGQGGGVKHMVDGKEKELYGHVAIFTGRKIKSGNGWQYEIINGNKDDRVTTTWETVDFSQRGVKGSDAITAVRRMKIPAGAIPGLDKRAVAATAALQKVVNKYKDTNIAGKRGEFNMDMGLGYDDFGPSAGDDLGVTKVKPGTAPDTIADLSQGLNGRRVESLAETKKERERILAKAKAARQRNPNNSMTDPLTGRIGFGKMYIGASGSGVEQRQQPAARSEYVSEFMKSIRVPERIGYTFRGRTPASGRGMQSRRTNLSEEYVKNKFLAEAGAMMQLGIWPGGENPYFSEAGSGPLTFSPTGKVPIDPVHRGRTHYGEHGQLAYDIGIGRLSKQLNISRREAHGIVQDLGSVLRQIVGGRASGRSLIQRGQLGHKAHFHYAPQNAALQSAIPELLSNPKKFGRAGQSLIKRLERAGSLKYNESTGSYELNRGKFGKDFLNVYDKFSKVYFNKEGPPEQQQAQQAPGMAQARVKAVKMMSTQEQMEYIRSRNAVPQKPTLKSPQDAATIRSHGSYGLTTAQGFTGETAAHDALQQMRATDKRKTDKRKITMAPRVTGLMVYNSPGMGPGGGAGSAKAGLNPDPLHRLPRDKIRRFNMASSSIYDEVMGSTMSGEAAEAAEEDLYVQLSRGIPIDRLDLTAAVNTGRAVAEANYSKTYAADMEALGAAAGKTEKQQVAAMMDVENQIQTKEVASKKAEEEVKEKQAKGSTATSKSQKSSSGSGTGGSRGGSGGTNHPESEPASPGSGGYGSYGRCFV